MDQWRDRAYDRSLSKDQLEKFWGTYFNIEKGIYEQLLEDPDVEVKGTVKELAQKYGQDVMTMVGFLDGINDSLKVPNPIETMTEDTEVNLIFDKEKLYKNMVDARADWLYELPQWEKIFDEETRKRLYLEQKQSGTIRKGKKIGRNDPCPCGKREKVQKVLWKKCINEVLFSYRRSFMCPVLSAARVVFAAAVFNICRFLADNRRRTSDSRMCAVSCFGVSDPEIRGSGCLDCVCGGSAADSCGHDTG